MALRCKLGKYSRSSCEAGAVVLASNLTPLPLASLNRGRDPQGSLGTVPWAGGTETAEGTGAKENKFRLAKRLARRLRERLSLQAPHRLFRIIACAIEPRGYVLGSAFLSSTRFSWIGFID